MKKERYYGTKYKGFLAALHSQNTILENSKSGSYISVCSF